MLGRLKKAVPFRVRWWLRRCQRLVQHGLLPLRKVHDFGNLRTLKPISNDFGWSRGQCIDRYYIEQFLGAHASDIRGRVLEFQTDIYTRRFGESRVTSRDILDLSKDNPQATLIADITDAPHIPSDSFDCIICTQVLLLIWDLPAAVQTLYRILARGGVLLVTVPGIAHKIVRANGCADDDYWRLTSYSARRLLSGIFPLENAEITTYGNVLAATAFLHGLAAEEFLPNEMEFHDPDYEVTVAVRAVKP